jgi:alanyl-tRNA synthetase
VKSFSKGSKVNGKIDDSRRDAITKHHSATHLMIATCRSVLGKHVWQAGSKKEEEEAHVDVTHYKKLSQEEEKTIECEVNERIFEAHPITAKEWDRGEAEKNYGFRLYQGGGAIGKRIRVVEVQGVDVEACGGLHRRNTSEIGFVRITHSEQVQDGVVRVHYKAGVKALEYSREESELIQSVCGELSVNKDTLSKGVQRIFSEWKERGKQVDEMQEELAEEKANNLVQGKNKNQDSVIESEVPYYDSKFVEKLALKISGKGFPAIVSGKDGFIAVSVPKGSQEDARKLLERKGAKGGGTKEFARGKRN